MGYKTSSHYWISCEDCGREFTSSKPQTRYCSDKCRQHAYRVRHGRASNNREAATRGAVTKAYQLHEMTCDVCGVAMARDGNSAARVRYCSAKCKQRAYRARRAGLLNPGVRYCRDCGQMIYTGSLMRSIGIVDPDRCAYCGADPAVWVVLPPRGKDAK